MAADEGQAVSHADKNIVLLTQELNEVTRERDAAERENQQLRDALERIEAIREEWDTFDNRYAQGFDFIEAFWRALGIARAALAAVRVEERP